MKKRFRVAIMSGAAMALLALAPTQASAQESDVLEAEARGARERLRAIRELEKELVRAEEARLRGDCGAVAGYYSFFRNNVRSTGPLAEIAADLQRQMQEIALQECPPGSGRPSISLPPPAPPSEEPLDILDELAGDPDPTAPDAPAPSASSPDTSDPSFIRGQMSVALQTCDRARFEELKRQLIARLDRLFSEATDEFTKGRLQRERELAQAASMPVPCPPESGATIPGQTVASTTTPGITGSVGSGGSATPPPAASPQSPAPLPRADRSTLIVARGAVRSALEYCDPARFEAAKARLLDLLDRLIADEPDLDRRQDLIRQSDEARSQRFPVPCPPESTEQSGTGFAPGFFAGLAFGRANVPQTGTGFVSDGAPGAAPERDAVLTEERIDRIGAYLEGTFYIPGTETIIRIGGSYSEGDASNTFDTSAPAGGRAGSVYGDDSPGGSAGISGQTTISGLTEVEMSELALRAELGLTAGGAYNVAFYADYSHLDRDHELSLSGASIANPSLQFAQARSQSLSEDYFGAGLSGEIKVPIFEVVNFQLGGSVGGYLVNSSLDSLEHNTNNFSGAADRDFVIAIEHDDSGFGVAADAHAGLEFTVGPGVSIFAGGTIGYRSKVGAIFNPNSGDQVFLDGRTTELTADNSWSWGALVGLNFRM